MTTIAPEHRVVLIRIAQTGPVAAGNEAALYQATREWWTVGAIRTVPGPAAPEHALAVIKGRVVAAYRIEGWNQREDGRRAFDGVRTDLYVGTDVSEFFPPHAQNALRYVNCSATAPTPAPAPASAPAGIVGERPAVADPFPERRRELRRGPRERPMVVDVAAIAEALDAEPLAHLMFGHKELFHTNLLAWFFRALPEAADEVFGRSLRAGPATERRVRREDHHLDLHMTWPGRERLVIENKVFSIYDNQQLITYAEVVAGFGGPARLVLLSTTPPGDDPRWSDGCLHHEHEQEVLPWTHLSYGTLAGRISDALAGAGDTYEVQTMRRYAGLVRLLQQLMEVTHVQSIDEEAGLPAEVAARIPSTQLQQAVGRARARQVANLVESLSRARGVEGRASSGFANGNTIVDWRTDVVDEDGHVAEVGWQVQGADFRLFASLRHLTGRTEALRAARIAYASQRPHWFDFAPLDPVLGTGRTPSAPVVPPGQLSAFNRFDPDFVYRYKKASKVTVAELVAATATLAEAL